MFSDLSAGSPRAARWSALGQRAPRTQARDRVDGEDGGEDEGRAEPAGGAEAVAGEQVAEEAGEGGLGGEDERRARGVDAPLGVGLDEVAQGAGHDRGDGERGPHLVAAWRLELAEGGAGGERDDAHRPELDGEQAAERMPG